MSELNIALKLLKNMTEDERAKLFVYRTYEAIIQDCSVDEIIDKVLSYYDI